MNTGQNPVPVSTNNKGVSPALPPVERGLTGFSLFYGEFLRATVYLPGFSFYGKASTGLKDVYISERPEERKIFWEMISSPPIDIAITHARGELVSELIQKDPQRRELFKGLENGYLIADELKELFEQLDQPEDDDNGLNESSSPANSGSRKRPDDTVMGMIPIIERTRQLVIEVINNHGVFENENLRAILAELRSACDNLGLLSQERLIEGTEQEPERGSSIIKAAEDLSCLLAKFGAINSFARLAKQDLFCRATFDALQEDGYQQAWNLLREKGPQALCSSPSGKKHVVVCGDNMAGKTFFCQKDLMLRLCAQSFGLAPAASANIHPADSFVWVNRTSPCPSSSSINGAAGRPSDFAREILVRNAAYPKVGQNCRWYSDESWTTTSPEYEYLLNIAEGRFLAERNVRRCSITHNQAVLAFWGREDDTGIYHFECANPDTDGAQPNRSILVPGIAPSHAFKVARSLGLPSDFLELGERYISGEYGVSCNPPSDKPLAIYDKGERERLKNEPMSLRSLIPLSDEVVLQEKQIGFGDQNEVRLSWRSHADNLRQDRNYEWKALPYGHCLLGDKSDLPFFWVSGNQNNFPDEVELEYPPGFEDIDPTFLTGLLYYGVSADSRELCERRTLFAELAKDGVLEDLLDKLNYLLDGLGRYLNIGHVRLENFPAALLSGLRDSVEERKESRVRGLVSASDIEGLNLIKAVVEYIRDYGSESTGHETLNGEIEKLSRIIEIEEGRLAIRERSDSRESISDEQRSSDNVRSNALIQELKTLAGADSEDFRVYLPKLFDRFSQATKPIIKDVSLADSDRAGLKILDSSIKPYLNRRTAWTYPLRLVSSFAKDLSKPRKPVGDLLATLRSIDSVHLNQYANYIAPVLSEFVRPEADGLGIVRDCESATLDEWGDVRISNNAVKRTLLNGNNFTILHGELSRLKALLAVAQVIRDGARSGRFAPAGFHAGRELSITDGWNFIGAPDNQVLNPREFLPNQQVEFSTGASMSGKSHDLNGSTWSTVFAQATGWVPARLASRVPIFARIIHIERVKERADLNLSAFGTEVYYWKAILERMGRGGRIFIAADEPFSSTSPEYRDALVFALAAHISRSDAVGLIATHCPLPVKHFIDANPGLAAATHHEVIIDAAGNIKFTYKKIAGVDDSNALEVAAALGYPDEILQFARELLAEGSDTVQP